MSGSSFLEECAMEWVPPEIELIPLPVRDILSADEDDEKAFSGLLEEE